MAKKRYSHKQIKKDIKRNELRDLIDKFANFTRGNTENILITVIIAGVIIVLIPLYLKHKADDEMRATTMYNQALGVAMQPVSKSGPGQFKTIEEKYKQLGRQYSDIVANYKNTKPGKMARLGEGNAAFYAGDYDKALGIYQDLLANEKDLPLKLSVKQRLGNCYEQLGKWQKALDVYKSILAENPDYFGKASIKISMANCHLELNQIKEAKVLLEEQAGQNNDYWTRIAKKQLSRLEKSGK